MFAGPFYGYANFMAGWTRGIDQCSPLVSGCLPALFLLASLIADCAKVYHRPKSILTLSSPSSPPPFLRLTVPFPAAFRSGQDENPGEEGSNNNNKK